jgi:hypothetical protein
MSNNVRNLWGEAKAGNAERNRRMIEMIARVLYGFFIVIGGLLAFDLYTRPDNQIVKLFGMAASVGLVLADITWAWATHHSSAGLQRLTARVFWVASLIIYALNIIAEYLHYLAQPMGWLVNWYYIGSISTVIVASAGLAFYLMLSPEQRLNDMAHQAHQDAVNAVLKGLERPDQQTLDEFNGAAIKAARELSNQAAQTILGYVTPDKAKENGHEKVMAESVGPLPNERKPHG